MQQASALLAYDCPFIICRSVARRAPPTFFPAPHGLDGTVVEQISRQYTTLSGLHAQTLFHRFEMFFARAPPAARPKEKFRPFFCPQSFCQSAFPFSARRHSSARPTHPSLARHCRPLPSTLFAPFCPSTSDKNPLITNQACIIRSIAGGTPSVRQTTLNTSRKLIEKCDCQNQYSFFLSPRAPLRP